MKTYNPDFIVPDTPTMKDFTKATDGDGLTDLARAVRYNELTLKNAGLPPSLTGPKQGTVDRTLTLRRALDW